jgi:hypothetical protein
MFRRATSIMVAALLTAGAATSWAQQTEDRPSLAARKGWVQFGIVFGRVAVLHVRAGQSASASTDNPLTGERETFSLVLAGSEVAVHYDLATQEQLLSFDISGNGATTLHREAQGSASQPTISFSQAADGKCLLMAGDGAHRRQYAAASFWHLMLVASDDCRRHLVPILETLRPDWQLSAQAERLEDALVRVAASGERPDRRRAAVLVAQLASDEFSLRRAAERDLRAMGHSVVGYLIALDPRRLDGEQRRRIRGILDDLTHQTEDTPDRVATWLVDDRLVWLSLLEHAESNRRQTAAEQMSRLLGRPIEFSPHADEATRQSQLSRLHAELGRK